MTNLFKILPILAIVVGIGGAWANQANDNPCTTRGTEGYVKTDPSNPDPQLPPGDEIGNGNLQGEGELGNNFRCVTNPEEKCFWAYAPEHPEADENGWMECDGDYQPLPN